MKRLFNLFVLFALICTTSVAPQQAMAMFMSAGKMACTVKPPPSYRSSATSAGTASTSHAVTSAAGIAVGDLLLIRIYTGSLATSTPSGWTKVTGGSYDSALYWRIADGTEGASVTITTPTSVVFGAAMVAIKGANATAPINASAWTAMTGGTPQGTMAAPTITPTVTNTLLFQFFTGSPTVSVTATENNGVTEIVDYYSATAVMVLVATYKTLSGVGATGATTATFSGNVSYADGVSVAIAP